MPINAKPKPRILVARIAAALLGGYALCWGFIALGVAGLFALGMPFHDAEQMVRIPRDPGHRSAVMADSIPP